MSASHVKAAKARWANISPEDRQKEMSRIAHIRYASMSKADRKKIGVRLLRSRRRLQDKTQS